MRYRRVLRRRRKRRTTSRGLRRFSSDTSVPAQAGSPSEGQPRAAPPTGPGQAVTPGAPPTSEARSQLLEGLPHLASRLRLGPPLPSSPPFRVGCVTERRTHRRLVLKVLALRDSPNWELWERFEREGQVLRSLRHPGVPRYVEHDCGDAYAYLLTERAPGRSLAQRLDRGERWSDFQLHHIVRRSLEVLAYLHELNPPVFHGDVHPEHLVVSERGAVALTSLRRSTSLPLADDTPAAGRTGYSPAIGNGAYRDTHALACSIAAIACGRDAAALPRKAGNIDLRRCMRASTVRDLLDMMLSPIATMDARELLRWAR